jgi:phosphoglycerate dehydrogenase-like enzyme
MYVPKVGLTFRLPGHLVAKLREQFPAIAFVGPGLGAPGDTSQAEVLLGWPKPDFVRAATSLRWIQLFAAGTEIIDFPHARERGIVVTNARGVGSPGIAEHVIGMMLHFNRRLGLLLRAQLEGRWIERNTFDYPELGGQTATIVGTGSIGREIARRAAALDMRVLGVNQDGRAVEGFTRVAPANDTASVISEADHVVLCVPAVGANARMVDASWLSQMKAGAHFYNVGRGNLVDETALLAALDAHYIAGAGLDVTAIEPLPARHPFWTHPQVFLTQHKAMNSSRYWERLTGLFAENLDRFVHQRPLLNTVDA